MFKKLYKKIADVNENIGVASVNWFNTMLCFWVFWVFSLVGLLPRLLPYQPTMLYISNSIQLTALPLLGFGMVVIERRNKKRDDELQAGHKSLQAVHEEHTESLDEIHELIKKIDDKIG